MKYFPAKYRFFVIRDNNKEVEVFPAYDPGQIAFTKTKWNDFTDDFKLTANDEFIFTDDYTQQNTETAIHRPYQYFETQATALVQSIDMIVKKHTGTVYEVILSGKMKILDTNLQTFDKNKRKFVGKIETTSKHQELENVIDTEINILQTDISYKRTATLVSEAIDYDNTFLIEGALQHILDELNTGVLIRDNPFNYITNTLLIENLLIADKTDIKRPNASSNATILNLTLGRIFKIFADLFHMKYRLTGNNEIYFEHPSEKSILINTITDSQIINLKTLTHGYVQYPKSLLFKYEESDTSGFINQFIEFDVNEGSQDQFKGDSLNCDIQFIINNQTLVDADPDAKDEVADDGAALIGCDSSLNIYEVGGVYNSKLQLDFLVENCFYYDLYFDNFTQNGAVVNINSFKKREKTVISIIKFSNFDINKLVDTSFGTGEITKANIKGDNLQLEIEY